MVLGITTVALLIAALPAIWLGSKWNRALSNVDKMIVPTVTLPTATPGAQAAGASSPAGAAPTAEPMPTAIPEPEGVSNILLVGTDARPGENVSRTDTLVLVHLDSHSNRVGMLSFPRDLWVNIPGFAQNRINTAYLLGETKLGKGYGPALLKQTVGDLTGLRIDRFMLINFEGFRAVIDKLGGIYVDVPKTIDDPAYPTDDYRTIKIHFDPGRQLMDGDRALIYARTRHADSDFGRNQRQQQVLMAIFDRVREQGLLSQLTSLDDYTDVLSNYIRTDISRGEMLGLASVGTRLHPEDIQRFAIDAKMVTPRTQPAYVLLLKDQKALRRLVSQMIDPSVASAGGEEPAR
ncbi:MAG TPA: LCP family protein [Kouleothrix sp.]|uniref:LCP family protein n=1 Tax=Kouleothrix sp. TaxID=2779161 RepID=UPI002CBA7330|nr:LCP family protein [Kouleothrix sp.]HRC74782.1 LCP family protein [Kouleothrix sp.]